MWDNEIYSLMWKTLGKLFSFGSKLTLGAFNKSKKKTKNAIVIYLSVAIVVFLINNMISFGKVEIQLIFFACAIVAFAVWYIKKPAEEEDIAEASIANELAINDTSHGFIFGKQGDKTIAKPETMDGHILVVGGVGSGKSSCIAIPSLMAWNERVFAIDIKGELYEKTKHNRPNINVFNPLDENTYGYDPFICLYTSQNLAQEARAIAQAIIPLPHEVKDPFWIENAQNIFTGAILYYSGEGMSFIETIEAIQSTPPKDLIAEIYNSGTREARYCVNSLIGLEDKTLSGIISELSQNIIVFVTDKNLRNALSRQKNITPDDLEFGNDIYINIPEHLLRQWKSLLTLIVNQFLTHFEQRSEAEARPILFLLDEFPRLGKVSAMLDGLATLRSKKISICLIIQSLAQLDVIYGQNERKVILDICPYSAILGASDADTQEYFSKMVGTYDKTMTSKGKQAYTGIATNDTTSEQEKRIIKPEEFGRLRDIVLLTPFGYFRVDKAPYYEEEN